MIAPVLMHDRWQRTGSPRVVQIVAVDRHVLLVWVRRVKHDGELGEELGYTTCMRRSTLWRDYAPAPVRAPAAAAEQVPS